MMGIMGALLSPLPQHVSHTQLVALKMIKALLNYLVALPEDVAPLGVAQDHPVHATVLDHRRAADHSSNRKHYSNVLCAEDSKRDEPFSAFFFDERT